MLRDYDEALTYFRKEAAVAPESPFALTDVGYNLRKMGRFAEAIETFDKALAVRPDYRWGLSGLAGTHLLMGKLDEARQTYQQLYDTADDDYARWNAHNGLAACYTYANQNDAAYAELQKVTAMYEGSENDRALWQSYHTRGDFCMMAGMLENAKADYDKWLEIVDNSDNSPETKNRQKTDYYLNMVRIALMQNDIEKAKERQATFMQLDVSDLATSQPYYKIDGLIATAEGRYDDAIAALEKTPRNNQNLLRRARAYEGKGDPAQAKKCYEEIIDSNSTGFVALLVRKQAKERLASLADMTAK